MSLPRSEPVSPTDSSQWFAKEMQPHGSSLKAYLHRSFPSVCDVDDIVQESYLRVWRRHLARPIAHSKSFLFQVARHLALDKVRRASSLPIDHVGDFAAVSVSVEDKNDVREAVHLAENVRLLADGLATLPARCREVVWLRKLEGLSQREAAVRLGISEKTVDEHLARGLRKLGAYLRKKNQMSPFAR